MTVWTKRVSKGHGWPWVHTAYFTEDGGRVSFMLPEDEAKEMEALLDAALKPKDEK